MLKTPPSVLLGKFPAGRDKVGGLLTSKDNSDHEESSCEVAPKRDKPVEKHPLNGKTTMQNGNSCVLFQNQYCIVLQEGKFKSTRNVPVQRSAPVKTIITNP